MKDIIILQYSVARFPTYMDYVNQFQKTLPGISFGDGRQVLLLDDGVDGGEEEVDGVGVVHRRHGIFLSLVNLHLVIDAVLEETRL